MYWFLISKVTFNNENATYKECFIRLTYDFLSFEQIGKLHIIQWS